MSFNRLTLSTLALGLCATFVQGALATDLKFDGQVRYRTEFSNYSFDGDVDAYGMAQLRSRFGISANPTDKLAVFVQAQEDRTIGDPAATAYNLSQSYLSWNCQLVPGLNILAGRFAMPKADERFFGASDWSNSGQTFDGWVLGYTAPFTMVQLYGLKVDENFVANQDRTAWGLYFNNILEKRVDVFFNIDNFGENVAEEANVRNTLGLHYDNNGAEYLDGKLGVNFNFGMQSGTNEQGGTDVTYAGTLIDFNADWKLGMGFLDKVGFGYESQSGDDSADDSADAWQPLYPTAHKFNGYMDLVNNGPVAGAGLNDIELNFWGSLAGFMDYKLDYHMFSAAVDYAGASGADTAVGSEVDLSLAKKFDFFTINAGYSMFMADDHYAGDPNDGMNWMYLQFTAGF